jgi:hypothetical protein
VLFLLLKNNSIPKEELPKATIAPKEKQKKEFTRHCLMSTDDRNGTNGTNGTDDTKLIS